jgi:hypothetical protein
MNGWPEDCVVLSRNMLPIKNQLCYIDNSVYLHTVIHTIIMRHNGMANIKMGTLHFKHFLQQQQDEGYSCTYQIITFVYGVTIRSIHNAKCPRP